MAGYLTRTISRTLNQLLLLFGGVLLLAFLLCTVADQIRSAGSSVFGSGYYYFVAPGVVCHETGHAMGCLMTGTRIVRFEPFRQRGNQLGCVVIERMDGSLPWRAGEFLIGLGPVWFGCLVIWLLTKLLVKNCTLPDAGMVLPSYTLLSSGKYWFRTFTASWNLFKHVFKVWRWRSTLNIVYLYLIFCIVSEMGLSHSDLCAMSFGFVCICCIFFLLNIVPSVGAAIDRGTFFICRKLFPVHVLMLFVLIVNFLFVMLFVWPIRFFALAVHPAQISQFSAFDAVI